MVCKGLVHSLSGKLTSLWAELCSALWPNCSESASPYTRPPAAGLCKHCDPTESSSSMIAPGSTWASGDPKGFSSSVTAMRPHATMEPITLVPSSRALSPSPNIKPLMLMEGIELDSWLVTPSATPLQRRQHLSYSLSLPPRAAGPELSGCLLQCVTLTHLVILCECPHQP